MSCSCWTWAQESEDSGEGGSLGRTERAKPRSRHVCRIRSHWPQAVEHLSESRTHCLSAGAQEKVDNGDKTLGGFYGWVRCYLSMLHTNSPNPDRNPVGNTVTAASWKKLKEGWVSRAAISFHMAGPRCLGTEMYSLKYFNFVNNS